MAYSAPGRHFRKGLSLPEVADMFANEDKARVWVERLR